MAVNFKNIEDYLYKSCLEFEGLEDYEIEYLKSCLDRLSKKNFDKMKKVNYEISEVVGVYCPLCNEFNLLGKYPDCEKSIPIMIECLNCKNKFEIDILSSKEKLLENETL